VWLHGAATARRRRDLPSPVGGAGKLRVWPEKGRWRRVLRMCDVCSSRAVDRFCGVPRVDGERECMGLRGADMAVRRAAR
jgi:hypothetical protein